MINKKVLISSMPWPTYNIPSIQIAVLKSYLKEHGVNCIGAHWFIQICEYLGFNLYGNISSKNPICGEAIYSCLYFPEHRNELVSRNQKIKDLLNKNPHFFSDFEAMHQDILNQYNWDDIELVGFTLNFSQTMASAFMAREIKKRNPNCKIIIGGAEGTSKLGASLIEEFQYFDFACNGEGEKVLLELSQQLLNNINDFHNINGLIYKDKDGVAIINNPNQLSDMVKLPIPDFQEYFDYLEKHEELGLHDLSVVIPIESSRGCYYNCTFCSLNIQWVKTRDQTPRKVSQFMVELSEKYKTLDFFFVDNITPLTTKEIFLEVLKTKRDFRFFYEMRANIPFETLKCLNQAGLKRVQIGIESMSSSLLKKFNKKCGVIHNIQGLKNCEELGIIVSSNFIIDHPCTSKEDIEETLKNNRFCYHLRPPSAFSEFGLMYGSPDYNKPRPMFSIKGNHSSYKNIYPTDIFDRLELPEKEYEMKEKKVSWEIVRKQVNEWEMIYKQKTGPLLSMHDGVSFLKIEDRRYGGLDVYILSELERAIYLYIHQIKPISQIYNKFNMEDRSKIDGILDDLYGLHLIFTEDEKYLSLAI